MSLLDVDLNDVLGVALAGDRRPPDGMLHPSGDLIGPLRHTMLREAGAPAAGNTVAADVRMALGTLFHTWIMGCMEKQNVPVIRELNVGAGLPEGWSGTADLLVWNPTLRGFVLVDIKTQKGEGFAYLERGGIKEEHQWQASAYYHALVDMQYPMVNAYAVWYVPVNEDYKVDGGVQPVLMEGKPLPYGTVVGTMVERKRLVDLYLASLEAEGRTTWEDAGKPHVLYKQEMPEYFLTDDLADPMPKVQKLYKSGDKYDLKVVPHWSAMFCPYDDALCACGGEEGEAKSTKIGEFVPSLGKPGNNWAYFPRTGYEDIVPTIRPKG